MVTELATKHTPEIRPSHAHHWIISNYEPGINRGLCSLTGCGAIRFFAGDTSDKKSLARAEELNAKEGFAGHPVKAGAPPIVDVSQLTREQKKAIAVEAKERGIKVVADEKGIPFVTVRAWMMVYVYKPAKTAPHDTALNKPKHQSPRKIAPHPVSAISAKSIENPAELPAWREEWADSVKVEWLRVYRDLNLGGK